MHEFAGTTRFGVVRCLGAGGMGVVYEAVDRESNCRVALKTLYDVHGEALLRLKNEFRALQDLHHPNLVSLGELVEEGGCWLFTMELVDGGTILQYVRHGSVASPCTTYVSGPDSDSTSRRGVRGIASATEPTAPMPVRDPTRPWIAFDEERLRNALGQLAQGLIALHSVGKVHRDIKPSNVLVARDGRVVLVDLGLVTGIAARDRSGVAHPVGTLDYMAPEQAAGHRVGPAADWYGVGVVLYEALTGRLPFLGEPLEVVVAKQTREPPAPSTLSENVPVDLDSLCVRLLRPDPQARAGGQDVLDVVGPSSAVHDRSPTSISRPPTPFFVGRKAELKELADAFAVARDGLAITVVVEGESGVGKTALVQSFTAQCEAMGAVVLAGRCFERETVPYRALDKIVDSLSEHMTRVGDEQAAALLPRSAALLGQVFPVLRRVKAIAAAPRLPADQRGAPQERRERLFGAMRELVARLADRGSLILVIDDVQWADADSMALLGELLRPPDPPAVLVLCLLRTSAGTAERTPIERLLPADARRLRLGPLLAADACELARRLLARAAPAVPVDADEIAAEAQGHPLFIDELVHHVVLSGTRPTAPLHLHDALRERVLSLPAAAQRVMELLAVAATPLPMEVLGLATGLSGPQLAETLTFLRIGCLVQTLGVRGTDLVGLYHVQLGEALIARLADERRRSHHRELALAFEAASGSDPEILAIHWQAAGNPERAMEYSLRAAEAAEAVLAFDQAARLYQSALEAMAPTHEERDALRLKLAATLAYAGCGKESAKLYLAVAQHAAGSEALELKRLAADQLLRGGHIDQGLAIVRDVADALGMSLARTPRGVIASFLWRRLLLKLRGLRFRERPRTMLTPALLTRIDACMAFANSLGVVDPVRGADYGTRALLMALRAGDLPRIARAISTEVMFSSLPGGPAWRRAERLLETTMDLARRVDHPSAHVWAHAARGMAQYYRGHFRAALADMEEAERILRSEGAGTVWVWELGTVRMYLLWSMLYVGRMAELARRVPLLAAEAMDRGDLYCATNLRLSLLNVAWLVGDRPDEARRAANQVISLWSRQGYHVQHWYDLTAQTQIDLYVGDGATAYHRILGQWRSLTRALLLRVQNVRIEAHGLRGRGALAAAAAGAPDCAALLREAEMCARRIRHERMPWGTPLGRLLTAGVACQRGDVATAARELESAITEFEQADMTLHAAIARWRLGELRGADGAALTAASESWFAGERVRNPARWAAMIAPGIRAHRS